MNGNVTFVGLNFQEIVDEKHLKKEGNNGEANKMHERKLKYMFKQLNYKHTK
jgi:hypothetical protein